MNVTVKTNCLSRNSNRMIEISFSSKPSENILSELKKNGWWWMKQKGCWSHYYCERNLNFAMDISNRFSQTKTKFAKTKQRSKFKNYIEDDPFAYLRPKTHMRKKHDYGVVKSGANMTSVYDCKSRLVCRVS